MRTVVPRWWGITLELSPEADNMMLIFILTTLHGRPIIQTVVKSIVQNNAVHGGQN